MLAPPLLAAVWQMLGIEEAILASELRQVISEPQDSSECSPLVAGIRDATLIDDVSQAVITSDQATRIARRVFSARSYPPATGSPSFQAQDLGPRLYLAVFPDGEERLVWFVVHIYAARYSGGGCCSATFESAAVYIDAKSGHPLLLLDRVTYFAVDYAFSACANTRPGFFSAPGFPWPLLSPIYTFVCGIYPVLTGTVIGALQLRRWLAARHAKRSKAL